MALALPKGRTTVAALVFVILAVCLYGLSWNGESAGFLSDDAVYLLMADGFSPFRSTASGLTSYVMRQALFPPLYPLLLAALGAGSGFVLWAHVITTTTLLLALAVFALWARSETQDGPSALGLMSVFALLPGTLFQNMEILSESPYLLFSLLAIWSAERTPPTRRGYGLTAVCVGLSALTRTAGLSLSLAFAIWLFGRRIPGRMKWLGLAMTPSLIWFAYKTWAFPNQGGYQQFWSWLLAQAQDQPLHEFLSSFLRSQGNGVWQGLLSNLDLQPSGLSRVVMALVLMVGLPVWLRRLSQWKLDAWYLFVGGAMIVCYPFPGFFTRLLLPWVPILLLYAYVGVLGISARWGQVRGRPAIAYLCLLVLFLTILPSIGFMAHRFAEPIDPALTHWKHTRYWFRREKMDRIRADLRMRQNLINAVRDVGTLVPDGDCVLAVHTAIAMLYGQRISQQPPPPTASAAEFEGLDRTCRYILLLPVPGAISNHQVDAFYPYQRLSAERIELVHAWHDPDDPNAAAPVLLRLKPPT